MNRSDGLSFNPWWMFAVLALLTFYSDPFDQGLIISSASFLAKLLLVVVFAWVASMVRKERLETRAAVRICLAAWLGLVPRQYSTGGKARLGRISKAGQNDIRRLLIIGAMTRILARVRHKLSSEGWIGRKLATKPKMLVVIALANKMARQIWAMLTKNEDYRDPALARA